MGIFSDVQLIYTEGIRGFRSRASRETNRLLLGCDVLVYLGALALLVALASMQLQVVGRYTATPLVTPSSPFARWWGIVCSCLLTLPVLTCAAAHLMATAMRKNLQKAIDRDALNAFAICCANLLIYELALLLIGYVADFVKYYTYATYFLTSYDLKELNEDPLRYSLYSTFSLSHSGLASYYGVSGGYPNASIGAAFVSELIAHLQTIALDATFLLFLVRGFLFAESVAAMRATMLKACIVAFLISFGLTVLWLQIGESWKKEPPAFDYIHFVLLLASTAALLTVIRGFRRHFTGAVDPAPQSNP